MVTNMSSELTAILVDNFDVDAGEISPDKTLDDLGVDSVSTIELIDILQERFGITIGEDELSTRDTVVRVIDTVAAKTGGVTPS
jgi:acyl carrier protein